MAMGFFAFLPIFFPAGKVPAAANQVAMSCLHFCHDISYNPTLVILGDIRQLRPSHRMVHV